jgi:rare lipoprotein A
MAKLAVRLLLAVLVTGCGSPIRAVGPGASETGVASYYADAFHGRNTASGERFDMNALTAAHPSLPFGTRVRVTHVESGRSVVVRINDRGPFKRGRVIDLSYAAARELGMVREGLARVRVDVVE